MLLVVGVVVIVSPVIKRGFEGRQLPPAIGYILLGLLLSWIDAVAGALALDRGVALGVLAEIGVIVLLFRVGLECNLPALVAQLGKATVIWIVNMTVAAALGMATVLAFTDYGLIPALFTGAALSATSVGVSTVVWRDLGLLETPAGSLLVDVAELDDISAVLLISLLFALVPAIQAPDQIGLAAMLGTKALVLLVTTALFLGLCLFFSVRIEPVATAWFTKLDPDTGPILWAAGTAIFIAACAEASGLSFAIGALFAGLAFSRDPLHETIDRSFNDLYGFFSPFFFVGIGLSVDLTQMGPAVGIGALLLVAAVLGKLVGAGGPAALMMGPRAGAAIGFSMVPRAEIALIVMGYGLGLGAWAMPPSLFNAMVFVSLATCVIGPLAVRALWGGAPTTTGGGDGDPGKVAGF
ncbi:MAG: cation:proton antiporter [Candidatus Competibacterales bacterium]